MVFVELWYFYSEFLKFSTKSTVAKSKSCEHMTLQRQMSRSRCTILHDSFLWMVLTIPCWGDGTAHWETPGAQSNAQLTQSALWLHPHHQWDIELNESQLMNILIAIKGFNKSSPRVWHWQWCMLYHLAQEDTCTVICKFQHGKCLQDVHDRVPLQHTNLCHPRYPCVHPVLTAWYEQHSQIS